MKECDICYGYGFWPIGNLNPIGQWDGKEWDKNVIKCPWCGAGYIDKGEKYKFLLKAKKRMEKEK